MAKPELMDLQTQLSKIHDTPQQIFERRRLLLLLRTRGVPLRDSMREVMARTRSSRASVYKDWERRRRWLPQMLRLEPGNTLVYEVFHGLRMVAAELWRQAETGDSVKARLGALYALLRVHVTLVRLLLFARQEGLP